MPAAKESRIERLGVIAGGGTLPGKLLEACDRQNINVFVAALEGRTDLEILTGRQVLMTRPGAVGKIISFFHTHNIKDMVVIGSIRRPTLKELRPDFRTAKLVARVGLSALGDDGVLKTLRREFEEEGIKIHGIQRFLTDLPAPEGALGRHQASEADMADIKRGVDVLTGIGRYDIGQALIIQEGIILGVEAAEGTDGLIHRCGSYRRKGRKPVLIKLAKPEQDRDLDLPTIGPDTVKNCIEQGIGGIVIHAGNTLVVDPEKVASLADKGGLFVLGLNPETIVNDG